MALVELSIPKNYSNDAYLTKAQLDASFDAIKSAYDRMNLNLTQMAIDAFGSSYVYDNDGLPNNSTSMIDRFAENAVDETIAGDWTFSGDITSTGTNDWNGSDDFAGSTLVMPATFTVDQSTADYTVAFADPTVARTINFADPGGTDTVAYLAATQTFTNKTLTAPTIDTTAGTLDTYIPDGAIIAWIPGYFTDGTNGGYTNILPAGNSVAQANTWLAANASNWLVCDGSTVNDSDSSIWNAGSRYLPNLTTDRFLMGDTIAGVPGGSSSSAHTHAHSHTVDGHTHTGASHNHQWYNYEGTSVDDRSYLSNGNLDYIDSPSATYTGYAGIVINQGSSEERLGKDWYTTNTTPGAGGSASPGTDSDSTAASATENRPLFLNCFYIAKIK